jgi:hypothetical protein
MASTKVQALLVLVHALVIVDMCPRKQYMLGQVQYQGDLSPRVSSICWIIRSRHVVNGEVAS